MQTETDTVQEGREGAWTHDRSISNRYMLSTSDKEGGAAVFQQKILLSPDSLLLLRRTGTQSRLAGECRLAPGDLRSPARPLRCIYLHWGGRTERGAGATCSRGHNNDAKGD